MKLPLEITTIGLQLHQAGFPTYLVGGCVRDLLLESEPKDWDLATAATPEEILKTFTHAHYDNDFGTVRIVNDDTDDERFKVVEITTFRQDIGYSDNRRPDQVVFSTNLSDDLARRDFTINALAYPITTKGQKFSRETVIDEHGGLNDLADKSIRTVGSPDERFAEDALRLMRAVRFAAQLNFTIDPDTLLSISRNSQQLKTIASERITDEFNKLIMTNNPAFGIETLRRSGLLEHFIPELLESVAVTQNQAHSYTVWEHLLRTCQAAADKGYRLELRLAALFHDIAKPTTREVSRETNQPTFYNHEFIGAKMTKTILNRLKYSQDHVTQITTLVRWHMFFSDPDEVTLSAVRRLIANVGPEWIWDLMDLRVCDRIGTGRPKEQPYRLRKFKSMIEEASRQPTTVAMLAIDGNTLMTELNLQPGRIIGDILAILLNEVLDNPEQNTAEYLLARSRDLVAMNDNDRTELAASSRGAVQDVELAEIKDIRAKYHVQ